MKFFMTLALGAWLLSGVAVPAQERSVEGGVITLVSRGVGKSTAEATRDACRSAVESAFGGVISAETRLRNESVFEGIVMAVAGSLENYSLLEEQVDGDWVRVKIRADVSRNLVLTRVADFQEAVVKAQGASFAAKARSKRESREAAGKLVADQIRSWPSRLLRVAVEGEPEYVKSVGKSVAVGVKVAISFDSDEWNRVRDGIEATLRTVASKEFLGRPFESNQDSDPRGVSRFFGATNNPISIVQFSRPASFSFELRSPGLSKASFYGAVEDRGAGFSVVAIASRAAEQGEFNSYLIPTSILASLVNASTAESPEIVVSYEDDEGLVISRTHLSLGVSIIKSDHVDGSSQTFRPLFAQAFELPDMQRLRDENGGWWILRGSRKPERLGYPGFQFQPVVYAFVDPALSIKSANGSFRLTGEKFVVPVAMVVEEEQLEKVSVARAKIVVKSK